jgi:hypothetical protein
MCGSEHWPAATAGFPVAKALLPRQSDPIRRKGDPGMEVHLFPGVSKVLANAKSKRRDLAIAPLGEYADD